MRLPLVGGSYANLMCQHVSARRSTRGHHEEAHCCERHAACSGSLRSSLFTSIPASNRRHFANGRLLLRSNLSRPDANAMPAHKARRCSIWIRRREATRLRDLRSCSRRDRRQMFDETGTGEAIARMRRPRLVSAQQSSDRADSRV
jgi:hypothetical protein